MKVHQVDWASMQWRQLRKGVERKAFTGNGVTLALHRISPGHEVLPHSHPYEQIVYILEGVVDFESVNKYYVSVRADWLRFRPMSFTAHR